MFPLIIGRAFTLLTKSALFEERAGIDAAFDTDDSKNEVVPCIFTQTLMAAEDHRFREHHGVDLRAICRALWSTCVRRKLQGASTIEQQLVRTIIGDYRKSIRRKAKEIILAMEVSRRRSKLKIASKYLSMAYFGYGMIGLSSAAESRGISVTNATKEEAATLIAQLKYPPGKDHKDDQEPRILRRANHIITRMESLAFA